MPSRLKWLHWDRATSFILVTVFIDAIGFGIMAPVLPVFLRELLHVDASEAGRIYGFLWATYAVMIFLVSPMLGRLSDRFGRRAIMLVTLGGTALDYIFTASAQSLWILFLARTIAGVCGANMTTASAYIADVTPPNQRAQKFGLLSAVFGAGFVIGPVLGGTLGTLGSRVPLWTAAALAGVNLIYGAVVLAESLPLTQRRPIDWRALSPFASLFRLGRSSTILGLAAAMFFCTLAWRQPMGVWVLFTQLQFGWNEFDIGLSLGLAGVLQIVSFGPLTKFVLPRLGERRAGILGLGLSAVTIFVLGFTQQGWQFYAVIIVSSFGWIAWPALRGRISQLVPGNEQGELAGSLMSLESVCNFIGPITSGLLFGYFSAVGRVPYFPGAPMLLGAMLMLLAMICTSAAWKGSDSVSQFSLPAGAQAGHEQN